MAVLIVPTTMLYCPKCTNTYKEGTQRFCTNDGSRLLAANVKPAGQPKSVFANLLNKKSSHTEKGAKNGFSPSMFTVVPNLPVFESPAKVEDFETEKEQTDRKEDFPSLAEKTTSEAAKPAPRLIKPFEIPFSQAKLGDRSLNPTGRLALTRENTAILLGQTIKGRYYIVEQLSEDETSIAYLAEDKIVAGKKVVVRVLMDEKDANDYESKIFAEERVSLSHINHPNIAHLIDSGELLEGKDFIVSEYVEGVSLREKLRTSGQFDSRRAARIIRQVADALGEAHENGVLHRNLKPENIIVNITRSGTDLVKVTDFAVFDGLDEPTEESLKYLSPEQLEGHLPNFASDIYSLAIITYQMLTGRVPFNFSSEREMLKAQREGLSLRPTNLRLDLSPQVDEVLEKALAYKPSERYPKARDFGDALYSALTSTAAWEKPTFTEFPEKEELLLKTEEPHVTEPEDEPIEETPEIIRGKILPIESKEIPEIEESERLKKSEKIEEVIEAVKTPVNSKWEKRSPEPVKTASSSRLLFWILGLLLLGAAAFAGWNYLSKRQASPAGISQNSTETAIVQSPESNPPVNTEQKDIETTPKAEATPSVEIESPPLTRQVPQPPNTEYFQNSKENLKGDLARNFRGFSFYYPNDWVKTPSPTNFADVARIGATGTPIEQFLVSYYDSKGTFAADREIFPELTEQSKKDLEKALNGRFTLLSQGETRINGEWKAYEMKFQGEGTTVNGDRVTLWGRRLWLPAARTGVRTGFVITLLATSISPEVKSADEVGVKGELAQILSTFEPTSLDTAY